MWTRAHIGDRQPCQLVTPGGKRPIPNAPALPAVVPGMAQARKCRRGNDSSPTSARIRRQTRHNTRLHAHASAVITPTVQERTEVTQKASVLGAARGTGHVLCILG